MNTTGTPDAPLHGIRVVTIAVNLPGPAAAARLVELGATVVKVEPPSGDPLAHAVPSYYEALARGQQVVTLDLKDPGGRRELDVLLADADLFLTSHRTGALTRLGLGWTSLHQRFPHLCHVAIVGHRAPHDDIPGHDLTYQAALGIVDPPHLPLVPLSDLGGAERAVSEGLAALVRRCVTGEASYRQAPLDEAAAVMAGPLDHGMAGPGTLIGGGLPAYGIYRASEGYVAVAAMEPHFMMRLLDGLGVDGTAEQLAAAFLTASAVHWQAWAAERDIPLVAVRER
jgi:crotonobetainyl-CoA:carnitine CoA-transferase CaiB-like acyl-CoA transferase